MSGGNIMKLFATILIIYFAGQNLFAQNTPPPEMPIPPEFSQPQPGVHPQNFNQQGNQMPQNPGQMPGQQPPQQPSMQKPSMQQPPQQIPEVNPMPQVAAPSTDPVKTGLPDDFELIEIKPYFKNKARLGKLTATITANQSPDILATVSADMGDCKKCIRGASVKGKLGIRLYGSTVKDLVVRRKQSSSIKIIKCESNVPFVTSYVCEFSHKDVAMKLTLKLEP